MSTLEATRESLRRYSRDVLIPVRTTTYPRRSDKQSSFAPQRPPYDGSLPLLGSAAAPASFDVQPVLTPDYTGRWKNRFPPRSVRGRHLDVYG